MKNTFLSTIAIAFLFTGCQKKTETTVSTTETLKTTALYSCPMHPEVTGKQGDACSKCGMALTEPVSTVSDSTSTKVIKTE